MRKFLFVLSVLVLTAACSNFHMEKRRYNKGFHVSFTKKRSSDHSVTKENQVEEKGETIDKRQKTASSSNDAHILTITDSASTYTELAEKDVTLQSSTLKTRRTSRSNTANEETTDRTSEKAAESNVTTLPKSKKNKGTKGLWYFAILATLPILFTVKRQSMKLGFWASQNVSKARWMITGMYGLGFLSSFLLGNLLRPISEEWMMSIPMTLVGSILIADAVKRKSKPNYVRQRMTFATFYASSFFGTFALGARVKLDVFQAVDPEMDERVLPIWAVILIIILLVSAIILATWALAIASCTLACGVGGAAGIILGLGIFLGGLFLIVFLGSWGILVTLRGHRHKGRNLLFALLIALGAVGIAFLVLSSME